MQVSRSLHDCRLDLVYCSVHFLRYATTLHRFRLESVSGVLFDAETTYWTTIECASHWAVALSRRGLFSFVPARCQRIDVLLFRRL